MSQRATIPFFLQGCLPRRQELRSRASVARLPLGDNAQRSTTRRGLPTPTPRGRPRPPSMRPNERLAPSSVPRTICGRGPDVRPALVDRARREADTCRAAARPRSASHEETAGSRRDPAWEPGSPAPIPFVRVVPRLRDDPGLKATRSPTDTTAGSSPSNASLNGEPQSVTRAARDPFARTER